MPVGKNGNLIPMPERTPEERSALGRAGALAAAAVRRRKRSMREAAQILLSAKLPTGDADIEALRAALLVLGVDEPTVADAIVMRQAQKAVNVSDTEAARFVRDTSGESPTNKLEVGNLDDKPLEVLDLSTMSDEELRALATRRAQPEELENPG